MIGVNGVSRHLARVNYKPLTWGFMCPRTDTHLTYMIDISLTKHFDVDRDARWRPVAQWGG